MDSNFSLKQVSLRSRVYDLLDDDDKAKVEWYAIRNEKHAEFAKNPYSIPQNLWPNALKLSEKAPPQTGFFFINLQEVFGSKRVCGEI